LLSEMTPTARAFNPVSTLVSAIMHHLVLCWNQQWVAFFCYAILLFRNSIQLRLFLIFSNVLEVSYNARFFFRIS
jgi:hypothetical protein